MINVHQTFQLFDRYHMEEETSSNNWDLYLNQLNDTYYIFQVKGYQGESGEYRLTVSYDWMKIYHLIHYRILQHLLKQQQKQPQLLMNPV